MLRSVNVVFGALCFSLSQILYRVIHPQVTNEYATQMVSTAALLDTQLSFLKYSTMH